MTQKQWHIALWVGQALVAAVFLMAGSMKAFQPIAELAKDPNMAWMKEASPVLIRFIGISELLGGLGLILPAATRIVPILTPVAALALDLVMVLAFGFHAVRGEAQGMMITAVIGALVAWIAWGRLRKAPIEPRG